MNVRIFGFGSVALDFRIQSAEYGPAYRDKLLAQETQVLGGGACANCLVQVARLGGQTAWLGKLGDDWIGREISRQLAAEGVDCSQILLESDVCSPFNLAAYAGKNRRRIGGWLLPNSLAKLNTSEIQRLAQALQPGDWAYVEIGEIPLELTQEFCRLTKSRGAKILLDVDLDPVKQLGARREDVFDLFALADLLAPNRAALSGIFPDLSPAALTEILVAQVKCPVVVTAGERGAWFQEPGQKCQHQPAFSVEIADTVGAGDAFHGGLIWGLVQGWPLARSVALGAWCGAQNCLNRGAREGMVRSVPVFFEK